MATTGSPRIPGTGSALGAGRQELTLHEAMEAATAFEDAQRQGRVSSQPVQEAASRAYRALEQVDTVAALNSPKQRQQSEFIGLDHILPNRYKVITPSGSYYYIQAHDVIICYSGSEQHLDSYYKFFNYVVWCQKDNIQTLTIAMIPKADVRALVPAGVRYPNEKAPERRVKD